MDERSTEDGWCFQFELFAWLLTPRCSSFIVLKPILHFYPPIFTPPPTRLVYCTLIFVLFLSVMLFYFHLLYSFLSFVPFLFLVYVFILDPFIDLILFKRKSRQSGYHFCFIFGKTRVQISAQSLAIRTVFSWFSVASQVTFQGNSPWLLLSMSSSNLLITFHSMLYKLTCWQPCWTVNKVDFSVSLKS
jgi:hypothetical protein